MLIGHAVAQPSSATGTRLAHLKYSAAAYGNSACRNVASVTGQRPYQACVILYNRVHSATKED